MKAIDPNSIPTIQENTKQVFKLKENISFFLTAVEEYGVPKYKYVLFLSLKVFFRLFHSLTDDPSLQIVSCSGSLGKKKYRECC